MSSGNDKLPPFHRLSPDDRGPIVIIVAYTWIFVSSIVAVIRLGIAYSQRIRFKVDDGTFLLGVVSYFASTRALHSSVPNSTSYSPLRAQYAFTYLQMEASEDTYPRYSRMTSLNTTRYI